MNESFMIRTANDKTYFHEPSWTHIGQVLCFVSWNGKDLLEVWIIEAQKQYSYMQRKL
jgi:hypothetical protein